MYLDGLKEGVGVLDKSEDDIVQGVKQDSEGQAKIEHKEEKEHAQYPAVYEANTALIDMARPKSPVATDDSGSHNPSVFRELSR